MATKKVIYFIAGVTPDSTELADIAKLNAVADKPYDVKVFSKLPSPNYGYGKAEADYVAVKSGGTMPAAYNAVTVIDPSNPPGQNLPTTQAVVTNGQKIAGVTGSGTFANIVVNPSTKAVTVTLSAS